MLLNVVGIYVGLLILRAVKLPVIREIPWKWFILWPIIALFAVVLLRILQYAFYFAAFLALMYGLAWLAGFVVWP